MKTNSPNTSIEEISLYFHVPFCTRKCDYCHFYVLPDKDLLKIQYMESLQLEWKARLPMIAHKKIVSIYFGGGTPFLLGAEKISEILNWVREAFPLLPEVEITLEANPENITILLMQDYRNVGINRVSIGIQTLNDPLLKMLTRQHNSSKCLDAVNFTAQAGIDNISIDLMYDLPGQDFKAWDDTLKQITQLPITHLSLYNLTLEPHTVFFKKRESLRKSIPNEELSLAMYETAISRLAQCDLLQYEISAFAKNNQTSKHNVGYWTGRSFLGLGPSAFSYWQGKRFQNVSNLSKYSKLLHAQMSSVDFEEELSHPAKIRELFSIRLRLCEGINLAQFQTTYGSLESDTLKALEDLHKEGFISFENSAVALTKKGILFYDTVASELI